MAYTMRTSPPGSERGAVTEVAVGRFARAVVPLGNRADRGIRRSR